MSPLRTAAALLLLGLAPAGARAQAPQYFQPSMGAPMPGLTASELARFLLGRDEFDHTLTDAEGRGPIFNDSSCSLCHGSPAIGGSGTKVVTRFGKKAAGALSFDPLEALGGTLLQKLAISAGCEEVVPPEADVTALRITPHAFGAGLLEAVADADILANEAVPPHPAVSGVASWVQPLEGGPPRVARFGWKGVAATVLTFSADASRNELGLTNSLARSENAPNGDLVVLAACDAVADPEDAPDALGVTRIERQTDFQRFLAPPPRTPWSGHPGQAIFAAAGCAACHLDQAFVTGTTPEAALAGVAITPYSDFLLHDMGPLGDGIVQGAAGEREMMTRALWGLAHRAALLHDGRATGGTFADNVDDAILEHDGEAAFARANYAALGAADKSLLVGFLRSLGRAEFDWDVDNKVDQFDWFFLQPHFSGPGTGPGGSIAPEDPAAVADVDQDGDFDLVDFGALQLAFTGQ